MTNEERRAWRLCKAMYEQYVSLCGCADAMNDPAWKTNILNSLDDWADREVGRFADRRARLIVRGGQALIKGIVRDNAE